MNEVSLGFEDVCTYVCTFLLLHVPMLLLVCVRLYVRMYVSVCISEIRIVHLKLSGTEMHTYVCLDERFPYFATCSNVINSLCVFSCTCVRR